MPRVPERTLSYGEVLDKLRVLHKTRGRQKEQEKALKPKQPKKTKPTNYSYDDVIKHINKL